MDARTEEQLREIRRLCRNAKDGYPAPSLPYQNTTPSEREKHAEGWYQGQQQHTATHKRILLILDDILED